MMTSFIDETTMMTCYVCACFQIAREIELHRHCRHKNVVGFHSYFEDDLNVYIILEICSRKVRVPCTCNYLRTYVRNIFMHEHVTGNFLLIYACKMYNTARHFALIGFGMP